MSTEMTIQELQELPPTVGLETAARAFGLGRSAAYDLARQNRFPCPVLQIGHRYRVTRSGIFAALGIGETTTGSTSAQQSPRPQADEQTALRASLEEIIRCAAVITRHAEELLAAGTAAVPAGVPDHPAGDHHAGARG